MVGKKYLEPMLDKSGFGAATEMGGFLLDKGPEVSLVKRTFLDINLHFIIIGGRSC